MLSVVCAIRQSPSARGDLRWLALQYAVEDVEDPQRGEQIIDHLLIERDLLLVLFFDRNVLGCPVDHNAVLLIDAPAFGLEAPSMREPMALKGVGVVDHLVNHHLVERRRRKVETRRYVYGGPHTLAFSLAPRLPCRTCHFIHAQLGRHAQFAIEDLTVERSETLFQQRFGYFHDVLHYWI